MGSRRRSKPSGETFPGAVRAEARETGAQPRLAWQESLAAGLERLKRRVAEHNAELKQEWADWVAMFVEIYDPQVQELRRDWSAQGAEIRTGWQTRRQRMEADWGPRLSGARQSWQTRTETLKETWGSRSEELRNGVQARAGQLRQDLGPRLNGARQNLQARTESWKQSGSRRVEEFKAAWHDRPERHKPAPRQVDLRADSPAAAGQPAHIEGTWPEEARDRSRGSRPSPGRRPRSSWETALQARLEQLDRYLEGPYGWLPLISVIMAAGLLLVALSFRASVSGADDRELFYWLGLSLLVGPAAARMATAWAMRFELLALVLLMGMGLYLVKVMHSPSAFTYADELVHAANAQQVLLRGRFFGENSILTVTPYFPGLASVTSALSSLSGLSIFTSGILVIGLARLLITLGLFLIYERLTSSTRLAALASVVYMANTNYLYWSAQYAYESLALPLAVFAIFAVVLFQGQGFNRGSWPAAAAALLAIPAVAVTHHLSSLFLAAVLGGFAVFATFLRQDRPAIRVALWFLALLAAAVVLYWNTFVASGVVDYLFPVVRRALGAGAALVSGGGGGRTLFESSGQVRAAPWERIIALASIGFIALITPLGVWRFWKRLRWSALGWVLVLGALIYFPLQALRLTGAGWETANRASEFLFVGIGLVVGLAAMGPRRKLGPIPVPLAAGLVALVLFFGGLMSGWPPSLRMARPFLVGEVPTGAALKSIQPQGVAAAEWARVYLGPGNRMAADNSSARMMQAYGQQYALSGQEFGIRDLFVNETIDRGELEIIRVTGVRYLVFARPLSRWDQMLGLYYNPAEGLTGTEFNFQQPGFDYKFDLNPQVERLLDTGFIVIYDIGGLLDAVSD